MYQEAPQKAAQPAESQAAEPRQQQEVSAAQWERAHQQLRAEQNLPLGIVGGAVAALVGAGLWAAVTVATSFQIGWMAVGVGFMVGFAVRTMGKGIDKPFGIAGAVLALLGCGAGNLLAVCGMVSAQEGIPFLEILGRLEAGIVVDLMAATFSPMDLLFYGIAVYEGYKLSFRRMTQEQLSSYVGA